MDEAHINKLERHIRIMQGRKQPIEMYVKDLLRQDILNISNPEQAFTAMLTISAQCMIHNGVAFRSSRHNGMGIADFISAIVEEREYQNSFGNACVNKGQPSQTEELILIHIYVNKHLVDAYSQFGSWDPVLHVLRKIAAIATRALINMNYFEDAKYINA